MNYYRELQDELFVSNPSSEFQGNKLPNPDSDGSENIKELGVLWNYT